MSLSTTDRKRIYNYIIEHDPKNLVLTLKPSTDFSDGELNYSDKMNRIKEALDEKGIKQLGWQNNSERVIIWSTGMCKTDSNHELKCFMK